MNQHVGWLGILVAVSTIALLLHWTPADATFPAANGKIAFVRYEGGGSHIYVMNADGSQITRLTTGPVYDQGPSWSPDGTRIVFSRATEPSGPGDIDVVDADGGGLVQVTSGPDGDDDPAWSPDGTEIAFSSDRGTPGVEDIFVMNADGTDVRAVTNRSAGRGGHEPSWSPDGTAIVFYRGGLTSLGDICTVEINSGWEENLTGDNTGPDSHPDWSPDGSKIVFESSRETGDGVYVMNADGSGQVPISGATQWEANPAWSPDGSKIVYVGSGSSSSTSAIWVMDVDGTGQTRLTSGSSQDTSPAWQPLAANSQRQGALRSWDVGRGQARLTQDGICAPATYQGETPSPTPGGVPLLGGPPSDGAAGIPYRDTAVIVASLMLAVGGLIALKVGARA